MELVFSPLRFSPRNLPRAIDTLLSQWDANLNRPAQDLRRADSSPAAEQGDCKTSKFNFA